MGGEATKKLMQSGNGMNRTMWIFGMFAGIFQMHLSVAATQCDDGVVFDNPITITSGGTYSGNWQSTDPAVPAVNIHTTEPVSIINSRVRGPGDLIYDAAWGLGSEPAKPPGVTLTVQNSCFVGTNPNVLGMLKGTPIHVVNAARATIEHNDFENSGFYGIWVDGYNGDHSLGNTITIRNNRIQNIDARFSDGNNGYLLSAPQGNAYAWAGCGAGPNHGIILSNVHGVPGIEIAWNQVISEPYKSVTGGGDSISILDSSGTTVGPLLVHDNYIQGGYALDPGKFDELHCPGSGFATDGLVDGETNPDLVTAFVKFYDNQAIAISGFGLQVTIGHDIEVYGNRVIASGQLADGTDYSAFNGAGIAYSNYRHDLAPVFGNNSFHDNLSGYRKKKTDGSWTRWDYGLVQPTPTLNRNNVWFGVPCLPGPTDSICEPSASNSVNPSAPTIADEANEWVLWNTKLVANGKTVGANIHSVDCLFNWAEKTYPKLFSPSAASSKTMVPYYYRYYGDQSAYLGVSSNDSNVYYLGPLSQSQVMSLGAASGWYKTAGCQ